MFCEVRNSAVNNNCYRPSVCGVLVVVAADLEVALVAAVFRRSGLRTTGMPKRGQRYVGALQTKKERGCNSIVSPTSGEEFGMKMEKKRGGEGRQTHPLLDAGHTSAG